MSKIPVYEVILETPKRIVRYTIATDNFDYVEIAMAQYCETFREVLNIYPGEVSSDKVGKALEPHVSWEVCYEREPEPLCEIDELQALFERISIVEGNWRKGLASHSETRKGLLEISKDFIEGMEKKNE